MKTVLLMILLNLFASLISAENFSLKWQLNDGVCWFYGIVKCADTDRDALPEIFMKSESLRCPVIFEQTPDGPQLKRIIDSSHRLYPWAVDDFDQDSSYDVLFEFYMDGAVTDSVKVYESASPDSLPGKLIWQDHLYGSEHTGISNLRAWGDMDGNSKFDFFNMRYGILYVYENTDDNQYELVVNDTFGGANFENPTVGDYDDDGYVEIVASHYSGRFWIVENIAEHSYELILADSLSRYIGTSVSNVYDNLSANDMDGDGKPEFILHAFTPRLGYWRDDIFIFEAISDNTYELAWYDSLWPNNTYWNYGAISDVGDIDADSVEELVLSTTGDFYVIKAFGDNDYSVVAHQNISAYCGVGLSHMQQLDIEIYDMDDNGLNDIVASATYDDDQGFLHAKTFIWEKGIDMEWLYPSEYDTLPPDTQVTLRWRVTDPPSLIDSVFVYFKLMQTGHPRILLFSGHAVEDSSYDWTVPDTSGRFRLYLVCTGPGRRDSIASTSFRIGYGIEEEEIAPLESKTELLAPRPNPARDLVSISYIIAPDDPTEEMELCIINASGGVVRRFDELPRSPGTHTMDWKHSGSGGVYFIHFQADDRRWVRKVVLWR
jgi:hypothetical protein